MQKPSNVVELQARRQRKEQVLEQLFSEHGAALRAFLAGRTRNEAEADDLLQDAFVRLARIEDLDERASGEKGNIRSFLFTVANNLAMDNERRKAVRRTYQQSEQGLADQHVYEVSPEVAVVANEDLELIKRTVLALPSAWRKAFTMSRFQHKSYREIASEMGLSVKVIEKYIGRSLIQLRSALKAANRCGEEK